MTCKDFYFPANVPRIFTSNATGPQAFHSDLPADPWLVSDEVRASWPADVKAVFKRTCFALVQSTLVPDDLRVEHQKRRRSGEA